MNLKGRTKVQLIQDLEKTYQRLAKLERAEKQWNKIEKTLRESESKYRTLFETANDAIFLIKKDIIVECNSKTLKMFGCARGQVVGFPHSRFSPPVQPDGQDSKKKILEKVIALSSGEIQSFEWKHCRYDGTLFDAEVTLNRVKVGEEVFFQAIVRDITGRKHAEELLIQAEEKYRGIFENAVEGIFLSAQDGQLIMVNPALAKMLGYESVKELIAMDIGHQIYVRPEERLHFMHMLERRGVVRGFECELLRKNGGGILVLMNARTVRDADGRTLYYEGTIEDISEEKKAADALRLLNEFNKAIIDNAPVAIFTLDRNSNFTSVNPALASLSNLGPEAEKKLIGFNWLKNPYTIKCGLAKYIKKGLHGKPFQLWDFPFMTYRGDRNIFMDFKGVPLRGKEGKIEGLLCIIEETTDRVRARAKLMQETKMSAIGRLAAGIAHELNNPLASLVAYAEIARSCLESSGEDSEKQRESEELRGYLNIIEEQAFRCKNVIDDLLHLPRKEGLEVTDININKLLDNILEFMSIDKSKIKVKKEFLSPSPYVKGDVSALRQVFVNLIDNALDAVEGRMDATLWIKTSLDNERVRIEIKDNGVGIPDTIVDKIFEPFFTTKEQKKGIGLGLSLCHESLNNMGGTIKAESKPGYGTVFIVALPARSAKRGE